MTTTPSLVPRPRRRLLRTLLKWPRDLRPFATPIPFESLASSVPSAEEAAAWSEVILLEDTLAVLHRDGTVTRSGHYISMLHGAEALARWDQVTRYYDRRAWRPTARRAQLYLPDGRRVQATKVDRPLDAQGMNRMLHVTFNQLRPGVILEWQEQNDWFQPDPVAPYLCGDFFHRTAIPCRHRRYTVAVAEPFAVNLRLHHGATPAVESQVGAYRVYRWELENVPGVEWDNWTPPARDFLPWVDYSTLDSWEPVAAHCRKELLPRERHAVRDLARQLMADAPTPRDKAAAAYEYAVREVRYGRPPHEFYAPASRPVSKMAEDLRGDCKDKSALLVALLHEAGIPAHIAVLGTRPQGQTAVLPSHRFDHAVAVAVLPTGGDSGEGEQLWLDAAAGPYTFGDVPYNDQGVRALILAEKAARYEAGPVPLPEQHAAEYVCRGRLEEDGHCRFHAQVTARGERAAAWRRVFLDKTEDYRVRQIQQAAAHNLPGGEVSDVRVAPIDLRTDLSYTYTMLLRSWARPIERLLLLRVPWAEPAVYEGPLVARQRLHPLATPLVNSVTEEHEIELPPGFTGYGLPCERDEECPWASYHCSVRLQDGRLRCTRRLVMRGGIVPAERFDEMKRFWEACVRSDTMDVVLVRPAAGKGLAF
jgi:hypothetical protein